MRERHVKLPTIGLIAGTRVALGIGIGLLLADRLTPDQRRATGLALLGFGALTTIPLVLEVLGSESSDEEGDLRIRRNPVSPYVTASN
jgi:hypothetical protein